ncbi:transcriptional regulator, XRE family [Actinobacteria bacterium OK074]|nr:transcriptional regulator, XRE family [Actinobacteria bacterium OK074]
MASLNVGNLGNLGEYLREQRRNAQLSLRQLADAAGVSNPYLSQIERGLRKPSAEVLQQVAKALRISAETLYVRAGILDAERDRDEVETRAVILADPTLNERQKQVLLQIYESFRKENGFEIAGVGVVNPVSATGEAVGVEVDSKADAETDVETDVEAAVDTQAQAQVDAQAEAGAGGGVESVSVRRRRRSRNPSGDGDGDGADPQQTAD